MDLIRRENLSPQEEMVVKRVDLICPPRLTQKPACLDF